MIIGVADVTFLASKDFKEITRRLTPHFRLAVTYPMCCYFYRYSRMWVDEEVFEKFKEIRSLEGREILEGNINWGMEEGALLTIGFEKLTNLNELRKSFKLEGLLREPLFAYDIGNVFLSGLFDVPLIAEENVLEDLTRTYSHIFVEPQALSSVELPIEDLSKDTTNSLDDYREFFSELKNKIRERVPLEEIRTHITEFKKRIETEMSEHKTRCLLKTLAPAAVNTAVALPITYTPVYSITILMDSYISDWRNEGM